jgi:hypothetical protein
VLLLQNFVAAIRGEARLLAPAYEAVAAVETANAILWSSLLGRSLELPLDAAAFEGVLEGLSTSAQRRADGGRRSGSGG